MYYMNVIIFCCFLILAKCSFGNYHHYRKSLPQFRSRINRVNRLVHEGTKSNYPLAVPKWSFFKNQVNSLYPRNVYMKPKILKLRSRARLEDLGVDSFELKNIEKLKSRFVGIKRALEKPKLRAYSEPIVKDYDHVPRVGGLLPGHALLKPAGRMLESAAKYPKDPTTKHLVYGNPDNFGITYNKTHDRILYTGFRRMNDDNDNDIVENALLNAILKLKYYQERKQKYKNKRNRKGVIVIGIDPNGNDVSDDMSNEASEILDSRRDSRYKNHEKIAREKKYKAKSGENASLTSSEESKDFDKNPGNPYTLHKNRYHQNYLWNHFMDGDHININQYAPAFKNVGPAAVDLFFGRKWWYFNQDDYIPLRRR